MKNKSQKPAVKTARKSRGKTVKVAPVAVKTPEVLFVRFPNAVQIHMFGRPEHDFSVSTFAGPHLEIVYALAGYTVRVENRDGNGNLVTG